MQSDDIDDPSNMDEKAFVRAVTDLDKYHISHLLKSGKMDANLTCNPDSGDRALHLICKTSRQEDASDWMSHAPSTPMDISEAYDEATKKMGGTQKTAGEIAWYLLEHGADINALNNDGATALDLAVKHDNLKLADFLKKRGGRRASDLG